MLIRVGFFIDNHVPRGSSVDRDRTLEALDGALKTDALAEFPHATIEIDWRVGEGYPTVDMRLRINLTGGRVADLRFPKDQILGEPSGDVSELDDEILQALMLSEAVKDEIQDRLERIWGAVFERGDWIVKKPRPSRPKKSRID